MNAKNKGNSFERKISKILSERFKDYTGLDAAFRRNIDSGSFFGGSNQSRAVTHDVSKATFGDIVCPNNFKFSLECKHYKTPPSFGILLKQESKQWDTWIEQARQDSENSDLAMMLIIKYNGIDEFVLVDTPFQNLKIMFTYKTSYAYSLDQIMSITDNMVFFDSGES